MPQFRVAVLGLLTVGVGGTRFKARNSLTEPNLYFPGPGKITEFPPTA